MDTKTDPDPTPDVALTGPTPIPDPATLKAEMLGALVDATTEPPADDAPEPEPPPDSAMAPDDASPAVAEDTPKPRRRRRHLTIPPPGDDDAPPADSDPDVPNRDLLTREEAAAYLRVSLSTIGRALRRGDLYSIRVGRALRVPAPALAAFSVGIPWVPVAPELAPDDPNRPYTPSLFTLDSSEPVLDNSEPDPEPPEPDPDDPTPAELAERERVANEQARNAQ